MTELFVFDTKQQIDRSRKHVKIANILFLRSSYFFCLFFKRSIGLMENLRSFF